MANCVPQYVKTNFRIPVQSSPVISDSWIWCIQGYMSLPTGLEAPPLAAYPGFLTGFCITALETQV